MVRLVHRGKSLAEGVVDTLPVTAVPPLGMVPHQNRLTEGDNVGHLVSVLVQALRFLAELFGLLLVTLALRFQFGFIAVHDGSPLG